MTAARAAAYGRAAITRSCARLSFDVATSSIVLVILRVLWTDRMRRRSSRGFGTSAGPRGRRGEGLELLDRGLHAGREVLREDPPGTDPLPDLPLLRPRRARG